MKVFIVASVERAQSQDTEPHGHYADKLCVPAMRQKWFPRCTRSILANHRLRPRLAGPWWDGCMNYWHCSGDARARWRRKIVQTWILTGREREILNLIRKGASNQNIGAQLSIELGTIKNHVHNVLKKLNVTRRAQAAAYLDVYEQSN